MLIALTGPDREVKTAATEVLKRQYGFSVVSTGELAALRDSPDLPGENSLLVDVPAAVWDTVRDRSDCIRVSFAEACPDNAESGILAVSIAGRTPGETAAALFSALPAFLFRRDFQRTRNRTDSLLFGPRCREILREVCGSASGQPYVEALLRYCEGGKRIRAFLVKTGYALSGGQDDDRILLPALSYELFQSGILIHDDLIDESETRRNSPSMHVALGNDHDARSKAICVGDFGIVFSADMILCSDFDAVRKAEALRHQSRVYAMTISGELKDIELGAAARYTLDDVLSMYVQKTSWYTFIGPLQLGAILGGADGALLDALKQAGEAMGVAFQIRDDILGIYGNVDVTGKSNLSDLQEGKSTVLTQHFLEHAPEQARRALQGVYGNSAAGEGELALVRELLTESGSLAYAEALCRRYLDAARDSVSAMDIPLYPKWVLTGMLDYLERRES